MLFQSPLYFPLLAACLAIYWLVLRSMTVRLGFIAAASVALLLAVQPADLRVHALKATLGAMILAILVFLAAYRLRERGGTGLMAASILVPLSVLIYFKYLTQWIPSLALDIGVPLGVSYYTFKHIHFLVESRRGRFANTTLSTYLGYVFFFPMFIAGPIERFTNFGDQARRLRWSWAEVSPAVERILIGIGKKFLISDLLLAPLLPPADLLLSLPSGDMVPVGTGSLHGHQILIGAFVRLLVTYFDFSGYTDMVLGTGRLFGFRLMENFDFPLLRSNLAEFWRAWHISLSSWARDYVYLPLLGRYRNTSLALLATMLTIGVWHGAQPGWALWGLHHGVGLIIYGKYQRWAESRPRVQLVRTKTAWRVLATLMVWWYVSLGYALTFEARSFASALRLYLKAASLGLVA